MVKFTYIIILLSVVLSGCAMSSQKFIDESYDEGLLTRKVKGRSIVIVPPLRQAQGVAEHKLKMQEIDGDWTIDMGSDSGLVGGEVSPEMVKFIGLITNAL